MRARHAKHLPHPPIEKRTQARARDLREYQRVMQGAADRLADALEAVEPQRGVILSRTAGGRIYCRVHDIQEALREMDELLPPALPWMEDEE